MKRIVLRGLSAFLLLATVAAVVFYCNPLWVNDQYTRYHLWRSHVRSETIDAGGYRLHYFEAVPPDGTAGIPLVLIHGLGARAEDWSPMIPSLAAAGFHVYAPDLLGYGRSAKPDVAYSISLEENVVVNFMRAVGLQRADFDGWSMGGWISAKLALDHPEMVDHLVLDDSAGLSYQLSFLRSAFVPTDAAGLERLINLMTPRPLVLPPYVVRATLRKIRHEARIIQQTMDSMISGSDLLDTRLGNITQPTLVVWGTEDNLIPISVGMKMHRDIPDSVFEGIAGCGHLAPSECARQVLAATIPFLKSQTATSEGKHIPPATAPAADRNTTR
jgi:pimeloyl-ACP methyl ester carboxylesterase